MTRLTDSAGYYLAGHDEPDTFRLQYQPGFRDEHVVGGRDVKDRFGRTQLQQYIRTGFLRARLTDPWPFNSTETALLINNYSSDGRTPMMEFLVEAIGLDLPSSDIRLKLMALIRHGANVNARSRGGHTVLHFAAGQARPEVVDFLLQKGVQRDHRDDTGRTAYDHAWGLFKKSRKRKVSPLQAARSFQSLAIFDADRKRDATRANIHQRSGSVYQMLEPHDGR